MSRRGESTEVDAYIFIKEKLKILGWDTRSPSRNPTGQVYTQNECLSHPEIGKFLGLLKPENVVKISETTFWVIEAKKEHGSLQKALDEAEKDYADKINDSKNVKVKFITGVAGNQNDSYLIKNRYLYNGKFCPIKINGIESTGLLSPDEINWVLRENNPNIQDLPINDNLFISTAEEINKKLHLGAVNPHQRASVMAAVLLSLLDDTMPNIDAAPSVLISEINARASRILKEAGKPEFIDYIKINLPATEDNHVKFKNALVQTIQELNNLSIRSALNSGTDVLGRFYEIFIKYANWAQDLGIVLTPRHITKFVAEVVNVGSKDIVLDITCGTGGFLVAAFDYVKKGSNPDQIQEFKENGLFGIEQDAGIVSLAIVNMIFRGDGRNNIIEGNCFSKFLAPLTRNGVASASFVPAQNAKPPITKVLMNPPFALKSSSEKEYKFVSHALNQMSDGGILFSILPSSVMVKGGKSLTWRRELLLKNNTLLAVITFPSDLFYPVSQQTIGVFVKKGIPHPSEQKVFWARTVNDGMLKKKGKRLPNPRATNDLDRVKHNLRAFLVDPNISIEDIPEFQKASPINMLDKHLELVPEAYISTRTPSTDEIESGMESLIRESVAYLIKAKQEGVLFDQN